MNEQGIVRRIAWTEICPWLIIFRTFRVAVSLPVLSLATLGALLTPLFWNLADGMFLRPIDRDQVVVLADLSLAETEATWDPATASRQTLPAVYLSFVTPVERLLDRATPTRQVAFYLFGWLASIIIWSVCAGAITRIAVAELGCRERIGLRDACKYTIRNLGWYIASPLFPLIGAVMAALPIALLGLVMRMDWGLALAALLWPLVLIGGLIMAVLMLGLLVGWPLMWPTVSSEKHGDAFEAFSRSFAYSFQRPLHYLFYALVAVVFGGVCWILVSHFFDAIANYAYTAAAWGAGEQRVGELILMQNGRQFTIAGSLTWLCLTLLKIATVGFKYSLFFCAASAVYLLLRRDVDQTDFDEIYFGDEPTQPQLPTVAKETAATPESGDDADASDDSTDDDEGVEAAGDSGAADEPNQSDAETETDENKPAE